MRGFGAADTEVRLSEDWHGRVWRSPRHFPMHYDVPYFPATQKALAARVVPVCFAGCVSRRQRLLDGVNDTVQQFTQQEALSSDLGSDYRVRYPGLGPGPKP